MTKVTTMTMLRIATLAILSTLGMAAGSASAQFVPGWGYGRPIITGGATITPFSISNQYTAVTPWLRQVVDNRTYVDQWTGVVYNRQYFSNPYGTWSTVRAYDPWVGPLLNYRYANVGPIVDPYAVGPYRPGFVIARRW
jgi:hypothetical protein